MIQKCPKIECTRFCEPVLMPFKAHHLTGFSPREVDHFDVILGNCKLLERNLSFTAILNDKVIGCGGIINLWPGCGQAWVMVSDEITKYPLWLTKTVRTILNVCQVRRIQADVLANSERNIRWIETLGFKREGLMNAYLDNQDYYRYALIRRPNLG